MVNLTVKNIPDELHERLKHSAERNRRSLNSEILVILQSFFIAPVVDPAARERRLKALRDSLPKVDHALVDEFKREGRS